MGVGALFLSFCLFRENKLAAARMSPQPPTPTPVHFLFHSLSERMPGRRCELRDLTSPC